VDLELEIYVRLTRIVNRECIVLMELVRVYRTTLLLADFVGQKLIREIVDVWKICNVKQFGRDLNVQEGVFASVLITQHRLKLEMAQFV
jgi:hypothetical protein